MMTYNQLSDFLKNGIKSNGITEFSWDKTKNDFSKPIPKSNGIYIMFETGQVDDRGERRIIRVGKAFRKKNGFRSRIKNNHFDGDIYNSIFRKHIAISLLHKYYIKKDTALYNDVEDEINNFLYSKISFILLSIDDLDLCNKIESGLIYLLAQEYFIQSFSTNDWLGSYSLNKEIPKYKLWNSDDTRNGHTLTQSEENYILNIKNYIMVDDFMDLMKKLIDFYLKEMKIEFSCKGLSAQEYFEQYGIDEQSKNKTSCQFGYNGDYLEFILKRSFELGYLTNPDESVLLQVEKDLQEEIDKGSFNTYNGPIAESSADLD